MILLVSSIQRKGKRMDDGAPYLTGRLLKAARALAGIRIEELQEQTKLGLATLKRAEAAADRVPLTRANAALVVAALRERGVEITPPHGKVGAGVRLSIKE